MELIHLLHLTLLGAGQLFAFAALAGVAAGIGHFFTRRLSTGGPAEALAVALAVGMGGLGTALFVLGLLGGLRTGVILGVAAAGLALGGWTLAARRFGRPSSHDSAPPAAPPGPEDSHPPPAALVLALALALLPTFVWSLFPPTGFDATTYHLPFAAAFAAAHRLVVVPELLFPVFPQLGETLFAGMLLTAGVDTTTHLVQFLALTAIALLLFAAGRRFFSPWAGIWAAALWLAHPLVHYQGASGYVDLILALFCLLAVHGWEVWRDGHGEGGEGGEGWLVVAGAAGGFAAATKYLGGLWVAVLVVLASVAGPRRRRLAGATGLVLVTLAVAAPWYTRIYYHTGNPVHPLLTPLFTEGLPSKLDRRLGLDAGSSPLDLAVALAERAREVVGIPGELAVFAWKASFDREAFHRQSPLAPWHLVLVPVAALFSLRDRRLLRWILLVMGYALFWTTGDPRFQLPSAALMALTGAGALHHLARTFSALGSWLERPAVAWGLAGVLAVPGPLYAGYKIARHGPLPPTSADAREAFLARELPGYAAVRWLNGRHGDRYTVFAIEGQYLTYFARGRLLGHRLGPYRLGRVLPLLKDGEALYQELRSMEVDYLLVISGRAPAPPVRDEAFHRRFRSVLGDERFELFELVREMQEPG